MSVNAGSEGRPPADTELRCFRPRLPFSGGLRLLVTSAPARKRGDRSVQNRVTVVIIFHNDAVLLSKQLVDSLFVPPLVQRAGHRLIGSDDLAFQTVFPRDMRLPFHRLFMRFYPEYL
jgi:hypothetical protein